MIGARSAPLGLLTLTALGALLFGCGAGAPERDPRSALDSYVNGIEGIRLPVNRLLSQADPILTAYRRQQIGPDLARDRISALERRFSHFTVKIAALRPVPRAIRRAQQAYAHTYILEDAYLSTLAAALPERQFGQLPRTQEEQRVAIIAWRTRMFVVAKNLGVQLPADFAVAGRGEIAPSPLGS